MILLLDHPWTLPVRECSFGILAGLQLFAGFHVTSYVEYLWIAAFRTNVFTNIEACSGKKGFLNFKKSKSLPNVESFDFSNQVSIKNLLITSFWILHHFRWSKWSGEYCLTFKSIFAFWDVLKHDLRKGWNFCLVWKLHQVIFF